MKSDIVVSTTEAVLLKRGIGRSLLEEEKNSHLVKPILPDASAAGSVGRSLGVTRASRAAVALCGGAAS